MHVVRYFHGLGTVRKHRPSLPLCPLPKRRKHAPIKLDTREEKQNEQNLRWVLVRGSLIFFFFFFPLCQCCWFIDGAACGCSNNVPSSRPGSLLGMEMLSLGTAGIDADSITLSACVEVATGCLKQATAFSICLLSLPKLYRCREWEYPPATFPEAFLYLYFTVNQKSSKTREGDSVRISWATAVSSWGCLTLHILFSFCLTVAYVSAENVLLEKLEVGIKYCATGW